VAADNGPKAAANSPFDVRTIKDLVTLMSRHDLSEIDLREGEVRIRLRRGLQGQVMVSTPTYTGPLPAAAPAPAPASTATPTAAPSRAGGKNLIEIKAETPGTFYAAPSPEAPPFVKVGSRVTPETPVCIIEAMKVMNEINAGCSGAIVEICVANAEPVEFEKVLFRVDPNG
jgi:acetyl-CoA carboxylase biotin carboxyl carrier protein